jgi:hypothetical protein
MQVAYKQLQNLLEVENRLYNNLNTVQTVTKPVRSGK